MGALETNFWVCPWTVVKQRFGQEDLLDYFQSSKCIFRELGKNNNNSRFKKFNLLEYEQSLESLEKPRDLRK